MKANLANLCIAEDRIRETFFDKDRVTGEPVEVNVYEPTDEQEIEIERLLREHATSKKTKNKDELLYLSLIKMLTDIDFGDLTEEQQLKIYSNPTDLLKLVTTEISMIIVNKTRVGTKKIEFLKMLPDSDIEEIKKTNKK